jgi:hypothetical protein
MQPSSCEARLDCRRDSRGLLNCEDNVVPARTRVRKVLSGAADAGYGWRALRVRKRHRNWTVLGCNCVCLHRPLTLPTGFVWNKLVLRNLWNPSTHLTASSLKISKKKNSDNQMQQSHWP